MTVTTSGDWPVPSESARVKWLLTVAEGVALGGVTMFVLTHGLALVTLFIEVDAAITAGTLFLVLVMLGLLLRGIGIVRIAGSSETERPPAFQDWWRMRSWKLVILIATIVGGGLLTTAVFLWGWVPLAWYVYGGVWFFGILMVGFILWTYTFYKIRGTVLR